MTEVVCLGDVMTDVVAMLRRPLAHGSDSPAPIRTAPGGAAANTAAWLGVTHGAPVRLVARVGQDPAGTAAVAVLDALGVRCHVAVDPARPTGTCIVLVEPGGERTMVPDAGANAGLAPEDVPVDLLGPHAHLHLSGYALLDPGSRDAARHALTVARERGASCSVDPASAGPLAAIGPRTFLEWVDGVDGVLANQDEARVLTGEVDPEAAARALTATAREVVVKLGAEGALWCGGSSPEVVRVSAEPVEAVDTTGAGDAFAAGWLAARLSGAEPADALTAGCRLAAQVVAQIGTRPLPPRATG